MRCCLGCSSRFFNSGSCDGSYLSSCSAVRARKELAPCFHLRELRELSHGFYLRRRGDRLNFALADGSLSIVFGTTALLSDGSNYLSSSPLLLLTKAASFGDQNSVAQKGQGVDLLAMECNQSAYAVALCTER